MKNLKNYLTILLMCIMAYLATSCGTSKHAYAIKWNDPKTDKVEYSKPIKDSLRAVKWVDYVNHRHPNIEHSLVKL